MATDTCEVVPCGRPAVEELVLLKPKSWWDTMLVCDRHLRQFMDEHLLAAPGINGH